MTPPACAEATPSSAITAAAAILRSMRRRARNLRGMFNNTRAWSGRAGRNIRFPCRARPSNADARGVVPLWNGTAISRQKLRSTARCRREHRLLRAPPVPIRERRFRLTRSCDSSGAELGDDLLRQRLRLDLVGVARVARDPHARLEALDRKLAVLEDAMRHRKVRPLALG